MLSASLRPNGLFSQETITSHRKDFSDCIVNMPQRCCDRRLPVIYQLGPHPIRSLGHLLSARDTPSSIRFPTSDGFYTCRTSLIPPPPPIQQRDRGEMQRRSRHQMGSSPISQLACRTLPAGRAASHNLVVGGTRVHSTLRLKLSTWVTATVMGSTARRPCALNLCDGTRRLTINSFKGCWGSCQRDPLNGR